MTLWKFEFNEIPAFWSNTEECESCIISEETIS
jgi:hypothetical protein